MHDSANGKDSIWRPWAAGGILLILLASPAAAQGQDNECDSGESPDVIVGDLHEESRNGSVGNITAFSIGTTSCNEGTCELQWINNTPAHPVIGANMYRLKDGRFEQIGQSWLKHGFFALSETLCSEECLGTNGDSLGVNCSDPYSSFLNGLQSGLGPKFEVNPSTGVFPYPATDLGMTGDAIYKRLQVHNDDLDPALNPGAKYFVEGHYVTADDAAAGNHNNNASHRSIDVFGSNGFFDIDLTGVTQRRLPAIQAWPANDPGAGVRRVNLSGDGELLIGSKVTDLGGGMWHYEYAVHNLSSHRSVGTFTVPVPAAANVINIGFHDVDYHSGEPIDGTDWTATVNPASSPNSIVWATETFAANPNANAIRWGTLYNFRFDTDVPPESASVTLGLWRPGTPAEVVGFATVPQLCDNDGICDPLEDCDSCPADCVTPGGGGGDACCGDAICDPLLEDSCGCAADCGVPLGTEEACDDGTDNDCDGLTDCGDPDCCTAAGCEDGIDDDGDTVAACDCDDTNAAVWRLPDEALGLTLTEGGGATTLDWSAPLDPGGTALIYEVIRSGVPSDFINGATCVPLADPSLPTTVDGELPGPNAVHYYLVRPGNDCPGGEGSLGKDSSDTARMAISCP